MTTNAEGSSRHTGSWGSFKGLVWAWLSTHPNFKAAKEYLEALQTFWHRFVRIDSGLRKGQKWTNPLIIALVFFCNFDPFGAENGFLPKRSRTTP